MPTRKLISTVGLMLTGFACFLALSWYHPAIAQSPAPAPADEKVDPNHVKILVTPLGFDPIKGELDTRLEVIPNGNIAKGDTGTAAVSLRLTDPESVGKQEFDLKKGKPLEAPVTKYVTLEGDPSAYPFDAYKLFMGLYVEKLPPAVEAASTPGKDAKDAKPAPEPEVELESVALDYDFVSVLPGFDIQVTESKEMTDDYLALDITVKRALPVVFFSGVVMAIMWSLSLIVLFISITILRSGKMPETGALGFMGALLFAFPAIRNAQPNVPPVGVLSDFISFFWTELIVVIALIITGFCWLKRYNPPPAKNG